MKVDMERSKAASLMNNIVSIKITYKE
jgi:hypothetical protein